MPQISPIIWLAPVLMLLLLLLSVNTGLASNNESENLTSTNPIETSSNQWNW